MFSFHSVSYIQKMSGLRFQASHKPVGTLIFCIYDTPLQEKSEINFFKILLNAL